MNKISVIVLNNNHKESIESILNQSYQNIEIIYLYDELSSEIKECFDKKSKKKIKLVQINNLSKWNQRIIGISKATGDYISFLEENDSFDLDYFRLMIKNSMQNKSDLVIANYVVEKKDKKIAMGLTYNTNNARIEGSKFFKTFLDQTGRNDRYHPLWNKMIKKEIWNQFLHLVNKEEINYMDDIYYSLLAIYFSKTISFCDNAIYERKSRKPTEEVETTISKANDLEKVFEWVRLFLKKENLDTKYSKKVNIWEGFYLAKIINDCKKKNRKEIQELRRKESVKTFYKAQEDDSSWNNYQELQIPFNEELSVIKKEIMNPEIKVVSFDMFDTLVLRPFLLPADMFLLLNRKFHELFDTSSVVDFGLLRPKCEREIREIKKQEGIMEITLDEIYDYMSENYHFDYEKLNIIKEEEIKMELHFCYVRQTGFELYELAKEVGKKVIVTSDIYLPKDVIIRILKKNGYEFDDYYISSEIKKTKADGEIYDYVKEKEKTDQIFHIGDNYYSDFLHAQDEGIKSARLIRTVDVMLGYSPIIVNNCGYLYKYFDSFNIDHIPYEQNFGVRCSLALAANYYFDNPFRPFSDESDFNGDPYFIGYYAMGMHMVSLCNWLYKDTCLNKIDSLSFMARDGYLPYKAMQIFMKKLGLKNNIKYNYTYVSRKSLMPLLLKDKAGITMIDTYLNFDILTPRDLLKQFEMIMTYNKKTEEEIDEEFPLDEKFETVELFNRCLSLLYDKCFDQKKFDAYYEMCKQYFDSEFTGNPATFDVGYSGKPEAIISDVIQKPLHTYFIHTNSSDGHKNSVNAGYRLETFFDFKPTISGALSELFISYVGPSCVGYQRNGDKVVPVYGKEKNYTYYNLDMIQKVQDYTLVFVKEFCDFFEDYIEFMDMNRYYMSIPMEYYYHYAKRVDRYPIKNLLFEANVNQFVELDDFILDIKKSYTRDYTRGKLPKFDYETDGINYNLPKKRHARIIYYLFKDRKEFHKKWKKWSNKKNDPKQLPKSRVKRIVYYTIFDRKRIREKIWKRNRQND